jgi:hypothetical protein
LSTILRLHPPRRPSVSEISRDGHTHASDDNGANVFFRKKRLNTNLLKSYVVIAAEIKEASQQMKQFNKLARNTQIKSKHNAPQLLWNIN